MSGEKLSFRRKRKRVGPSTRGLAAILVFAVGLALARPLIAPEPPQGTLIEVTGDVPQPGMWAVSPPTIHQAVRAAGGDIVGLTDAGVPDGFRVHVSGDRAQILKPSDPLLVGLPVNVNASSAIALAAIPGIGPQTADAIVQEREKGGLFYEITDLYRARGVGPSAVALMQPFITLGDPGPRPAATRIDVNHADAETLERLPRIGPVTAARIVVDRDENGPYDSVSGLQRVKGIGPATVREIEALAEALP